MNPQGCQEDRELIMNKALSRLDLDKILQLKSITESSYAQLAALFEVEPGIREYLPEGICQIDPRSGERVLYNPARGRRPHDNRALGESQSDQGAVKACLVCEGKTTAVIDVADLSEGFTFINKNLYPIVFPQKGSGRYLGLSPEHAPVGPAGIPVHGLHFLQWTSSFHDKDWHNMPVQDLVLVLRRLAILEKLLLTSSTNSMPSNRVWGDQPKYHGFVSIIKNVGQLVGGSLAHGHQQIAFSNIIPKRAYQNWRFEAEMRENFSTYLLRTNPEELVVNDYGQATLLVPYFMRRPYEMLLLLKDTSKRYLHQLNTAEMAAVASGWKRAIAAIHTVMPEIGREIAFNVITHNGPGCGLYFEFLPYTQENGGFELLGLSVCQANPLEVAQGLREM